jgi:circadian clock protein KaiB
VRFAPNSARAIANLHTLGREWLGGRYEVEIVDVLEAPLRALQDQIIVTPTLIKLSPPRCVIVGNLSDIPAVVQALRLDASS